MKTLIVVIVLTLITGCTTTNQRKDEFAAIEIGMVKSEVLEIAGPPHWSDRHYGMDRWIYYMQPEDKQTERVLYFRQGKVFQKGERIKPILTAEEIEEIKKPRLKKQKPFKPSMSEEQMRQAIKKEIEKEQKTKTSKPKFEEI